MTKILFGKHLACAVCNTPFAPDKWETGEDGDADFRWCEICGDFEDAISIPTDWRKCSKCNKIKDPRSFYARSIGGAVCKLCYRERVSKYQKEHPEKHLKSALKYERKNWRKRRLAHYNLTEEDYDNLLKKQNKVCAICLCKNKSGKRLSVDHNHKTGKVRGLLCNKCNWGLGHFVDDGKILKNAISYLKRA